jgi:metallophosphoesterase (TIGR00282 family)
MRILFVGDIVGKGGRKAVVDLVPELKRELNCGFCVANGENMAGGAGITRKCVEQITAAGVDVVTGGDHMWDQRELADDIETIPNLLRPANANAAQPGRGWLIAKAAGGIPVAVICLLGRTFINASSDSPFSAVDRVLAELQDKVRHILVDFHAEATSEKIAMGRHLTGRVSAVLGTHTHVATADEAILPGGTAFQCDVGMVGGRDSILGRAIAPVLQRFTTGMPSRFTVVEHGIRLHATVVELDDSGRASEIRRVWRDWD